MNSNILGKSLRQWTGDDVQGICHEAMAEGSDLEFKRTLSTKNGQPDVWFADQSAVGEEAKDKLIREIIAFANAHGGTLVLGIEETSSKPARAMKVLPLPKCADLAERLRLVCRDLVEPKLAVVEVEGVVTTKDGSGVVVFHVPPSRMAPHRHVRLKDCYVRRADRSEAMTMREIQDLTLFVERGAASIEREFERREQALTDRASGLFREGATIIARWTAMPLVPLSIHRVHGRSDARPELRAFMAGTHECSCAFRGPDRWRPFIGGTRAEVKASTVSLDLSLSQGGVVDFTFVVRRRPEEETPGLFLNWFIGFVSSGLLSAHKFRCAAGAPDAEVGIALEIWVASAHAAVAALGDRHGFEHYTQLPNGRHRFPRYSLGEASEMSMLVNEMLQDLANAGGDDFPVNLSVDFETHLKQLGLA